MSPKEKIAKLEALLARVKARAERPRTNGAARLDAEASPPVEASAPAAVHAEAPLTRESVAPELGSGWSDPPEELALEDAAILTDDVDVEVSAEVVEVDIDIDDPPLVPAESGAQPVAHQADIAAAEQALVEQLSRDLVSSAPSVPPVDAELGAAPHDPPAPANELVEPAPSSSPRPIEAEPERYDAESAPRHTPPPESGKQVAVASAKPEAPPSSGPPSIEGHTLIGGWHEPGLALPREQASDAPRAPSASPPEEAETSPSAPPTRREQVLAPHVVEPALASEANVAAFEGSAPSFAPTTFGELLDATLGL